MRVAVTGGAGFIGSHVVDQMIGAGHETIVVDARAPHRADAVWREIDIRDGAGLVRATRGCDAILHLAGVSNVNEAREQPVHTFDVNVNGTALVCDAARRNGVARTVLASTVWVYAASNGQDPVDEDSPMALQGSGHVYTASKMASELVLTSHHELYGLEYTILRYGIPFGPRMREELVIPRFVQRAFDGRPLTIHGDGQQFRNYVYVEDIAAAHVLALGAAGANQVFNLEGPQPVSVVEMAEVIRDLVDRTLAIEFAPARPGDYAGRFVSGDKAAKVLGWRPTTSFVAGMRRYLEWRDAETTDRAREA